MTVPLVSVIMPCYNAASFVKEAVGSVLGQTYPHVELIVIDDGSTDESYEIVTSLCSKYPDRIRHAVQVNSGPYVARNHGLRLAKGEYVAFLDADDWWLPDFLEKMLPPLLDDTTTVLTYCGWQNVGLEGGRGEPYVPPDYESADKAVRFLRAASPWPIHAALVRKRVLDALGGFHLDLPTCMDYDLWLRIAVPGRIRRVPEVMAVYRHHHAGQITSKQWIQARNVWWVKRKFVREHPHLVRHLPADTLRELIDGALLRRGYDSLWRRDLVSAQKIFRMCLFRGYWSAKDLYYLLPAFLPARAYQALVRSRDHTG